MLKTIVEVCMLVTEDKIYPPAVINLPLYYNLQATEDIDSPAG